MKNLGFQTGTTETFHQQNMEERISAIEYTIHEIVTFVKNKM